MFCANAEQAKIIVVSMDLLNTFAIEVPDDPESVTACCEYVGVLSY